MMFKKDSFIYRILVLLVLSLFLNLPIVSALEISNIRAEDVTDVSATVKWTTDEAANSFVKYGFDKNDLIKVGDALSLIDHKIVISSLNPETKIFYSVESEGVIDDNVGELYSFTTTAPDITPPLLEIDLPSVIAGNKLNLIGKSEIKALIKIKINGVLISTTEAVEIQIANLGNEGDDGNDEINESGELSVNSLGSFFFENLLLLDNKENLVVVEAIDQSGNIISKEGKIFADTSKPKITIEEVPSLTDKNSILLKGNISEIVNLELFVNNLSSIKKENVDSISENLNLKEGENKIKIFMTDLAGWNNSKEFSLSSDTLPPTVTVEIEKGQDYYEGRAESNIHGKTEPGAKAFLYVYKPQGYEFKPEFDSARAVVTANEKGEFIFNNVGFESTILESLKKGIKPKRVPSGLEKLSIFPIGEVAQQQRSTYHLYIIVEDKSGKTGYWQGNVQVHSCYSGDLDFSVSSVPEFQAPLRLVPELLDSGRQEIQAVFDLEYFGSGVPKLSDDGQVIEPGFKISSVQVERACTPGMQSDDRFGIGCKIMPNAKRRQILSQDGTKLYVVWKLNSAEKFSEKENKFWDDFKKRVVTFPLKLRISYQERLSEGKFSSPKHQSSCSDLGYMIDIPLDSKEYIPDFLADEGITALNYTIDKIQTIKPYLEDATVYTAMAGMATFALRTLVRITRIITAKLEYYYSIVKTGMSKEKQKTEGCPLDQSGLYLKSTIINWKKLPDNAEVPDGVKKGDPKVISLEERCPKTAGMWKAEAALEQAYKWTWDRAFCRAVPAGWTETEDIDKIQQVQLKQQQCAVSGKGITLVKVEDCNKIIKDRRITLTPELKTHSGTCWRVTDGTHYVYLPEKQTVAETSKGIFRLDPVAPPLSDISLPKDRLVVYKPAGTEEFIVGLDKKCEAKGKEVSICDLQRAGKKFKGKCKAEKVKGGVTSINLKDNEYSAGYTKDCSPFNGETSGPLEQCVCIGEKEEKDIYPNARTAIKKKGNIGEEWFYRQERIFRESGKTKGTYYPTERYYADRDRSGAFGADYVTDYFRGKGEKTVAKINPHTGFVHSLQSACLSGVLKNLVMLESILVGARTCIIEAKYTGFHDAGMCKALFTQHVCGLMYKTISSFVNGCSPSYFSDVKKEGAFKDVSAIISAGQEGIASGLKTSIDDVKEDYGNAALNQYFKGGVQGVAQSMCLAALGFDVPLLSKEFYLDAAYSFPMASVVAVAPASRELSTYDPEKQSAIYNYRVGGVIVPGCKIKGWKLSLKCVGPEDVGREGLDSTCDGKGCDCLNVPQAGPEVSRKHLLASGGSIPSGRMFDIPLEVPIQLSAQYRYDHAVLELMLDPTEKDNAESCLDDNFRHGNKGVYYYPLSDDSPPGSLNCKASAITGRYSCPELSKFFGFGGSYLEEPYITCWDKKTEDWVSCDTPNLFVMGDKVKIRPHLYTDGKGLCLKRKLSTNVPGVPKDLLRSIPKDTPGPLFFPDELLSSITENTFGGSSSHRVSQLSSSSNGCGLATKRTPDTVTNSGQIYSFESIPSGGKIKFKIDKPNLVSIVSPAGFEFDSFGQLKKGNENTFTKEQINSIEFNLGGFVISDILQNVDSNSNSQCVYQVTSANSIGSTINSRQITVTYELYEKDAQGGCTYAKNLIKTGMGKNRISKKIRLQKHESAFQRSGGAHEAFMNGNYQQVHTLVLESLNDYLGDLNNALAIYYSTLSYVKQNQVSGNHAPNIKTMLKYFFTREWGGEKAKDYSPSVVQLGEFKKISKYLCEIDQKFGKEYQGSNFCSGGSVLPSSGQKTSCETESSTKNTHNCQDTLTRGDGSTGCISNKCQNSVLKSQGKCSGSGCNKWKCCPK